MCEVYIGGGPVKGNMRPVDDCDVMCCGTIIGFGGGA